MEMTFSLFVTEHHFTLKCFPKSDERQKIVQEKSEIYPNYFLDETFDSFGNKCVYGKAFIPHNYFAAKVSGIAEVSGENPYSFSDGKESLFKYPTKLTECGKKLESFHKSICSRDGFEGLSVFDKAEFFMSSLFRVFRYASGVTGVFTSGEEAFALCEGVCQDYAHILLSLCRKSKIPCRYVAGMMIGEGASHAWVEVFDGEKWLSLDPTHNRRTDDTYIVISRGRDAQDCSINQGVFTGGGNQKQEIFVCVEEIGDKEKQRK